MTYALLLDAIQDDGADRSAIQVSHRGASVHAIPDAAADAGSDDAAFVARIRAGDISAFDHLFERWWTLLWRFARSELASSAAAEDIVQHVFARLWLRRAEWIPTHGIQTYLYGAVRNAIIDDRRHTRIVRAHAEHTVREREGALSPSPDMGAERQDLVERLDAALARLPADRRQAVVLRYEHGLTYPQLAAVLGASPAAVEKQVARAVEALRAWVYEP